MPIPIAALLPRYANGCREIRHRLPLIGSTRPQHLLTRELPATGGDCQQTVRMIQATSCRVTAEHERR
jgi:hypothetical protein